MNWRPPSDPGPLDRSSQAVQDEIICCALEADMILTLGDWESAL